MRIKAQTSMVMNLDKCIGCHTCSIPCKNVWTNRAGAEYIWYNDVETKPGLGYPRKWEDQQHYRGGWWIRDGKLALRAGGKEIKMARIFNNPDLPRIDDYYEPFNYNYEHLISSPHSKHQPATRPFSQITGKNMEINWGPNWDDDLAGLVETASGDVDFAGLDYRNYLRFENVFMFYLPRICEHCLNPSCVASCPSGALYKRDEDGIVLVDQEKCRGWRFCVSGCPYKKVYFNWKTGRSEKCLFCYPRVEAGMPTLCAETCVGRIRYIGVLLYDADRIHQAASVREDREVYPVLTSIFLNPRDPEVAREAAACGIHPAYLAAARHSPVYELAVEWKLALPPHPEFRTLPMVWYIPPLNPFYGGNDETSPDLNRMRIPLKYLANLLSAGDEGPVRLALEKMMALMAYMRSVRVKNKPDGALLERAGLNAATAGEMYRLLALARYEERYVIPTARRESADLAPLQGLSGFPGDRKR